MIKIDSPGPVFFRQVRVGAAGQTFRIFKFRSMQLDRLLMRVVREGEMMMRSTSSRRTIAGRRPESPSTDTCSRSCRRSLGLVSTKPTRLIPYSGWVDLFREQLADVARTDDDGVLDVGLVPGASPHAPARAIQTSVIAAAQKTTSFCTVGCAMWLRYVTTMTSQVQTVTMWKTPPKSSAVEWLRALVVVVIEAVEFRDHHHAEW